MKRDGIPFSTELPGPLARRLRQEKARTGRSLKVITAAFLRHCLRMGERQRTSIVREYAEESAGPRGTPDSAALDDRQGPSAGDETALGFEEVVTIEELARRQGVGPVDDLGSLVADFWPPEESVDDFIAAVRKWRAEPGSGSGEP